MPPAQESFPTGFAWIGTQGGLLHYLINGMHIFRFEDSEHGGTTLVQEEEFTGGAEMACGTVDA